MVDEVAVGAAMAAVRIGAIKATEHTAVTVKDMGVVMTAMGAGTIITAEDMEVTAVTTTRTTATMVNTLTGIKVKREYRWRSVVPPNIGLVIITSDWPPSVVTACQRR